MSVLNSSSEIVSKETIFLFSKKYLTLGMCRFLIMKAFYDRGGRVEWDWDTDAVFCDDWYDNM